MRVNVMGLFNAEGTPEQLSEYTARLMLILKNWTDKQEQAQIQKEIMDIWNGVKKEKGGEEEP